MTPEAREKRNAYMRKWRAENPDKVRRNNERYWERKARKGNELKEWRCDDCGKLLGKVRAIGLFFIETKCNRCKSQVVYSNDAEALEAL